MVYVDERGIQRHVKGIDDKLTVRQKPGPAPGKSMAILSGRHADLLCVVTTSHSTHHFFIYLLF